jgi:hypothetical protein
MLHALETMLQTSLDPVGNTSSFARPVTSRPITAVSRYEFKGNPMKEPSFVGDFKGSHKSRDIFSSRDGRYQSFSFRGDRGDLSIEDLSIFFFHSVRTP